MEEAEEAICTIQQIFVPITSTQVAEVKYPSSVDGEVVDEVISSTEVISRDCSSESESDWIEPALHLYNSRSSQYSGKEHILDAVHLFQTNPPFKRMVSALSTDPAVWDAVMKNEVVQELKKSFYEARSSSEPHTPDEDPGIPTGILRWIMDSTKGKIMEFFGMISKLVNDIFPPHYEDKEPKPFDNVVKSSFMLSVAVFIIVVMTRIQKG
ncbi:uncharacterized protein LOC109839488 [Asparagus officinalis]|nr:uncharacterized protein LOC109839488 [Asparagus officinalis]